MSNILVVLLFSHFVGDFYLQSEKSVERKHRNYVHTLLHSVIYAIPGALLLLIYTSQSILWFYVIYVIAHFLIDSIKFALLKKQGARKFPELKNNGVLKINWIFIIDQIAHIATIMALAVCYMHRHGDIMVSLDFVRLCNMEAAKFYKVMKALLIVAIILKPVSLTFYQIVNIDKLAALKKGEDKEEKDNTLKGSGELIGYLERIIIVLLLFLGEYAAIGLVVAAKSIARFNSDVKAEFYIIGTFYGVVSTIIPFVLIWIL